MPLPPTRRDWLALLVVQAAILGVIVAVVPYRTFELDRFFVPKELVLHAGATLAALLAVGPGRRMVLTRVDWLLLGFLVLSAVSAGFATNWWIAARAFAISWSGVLLYWSAAALARRGLGPHLLAGALVGVLVGAATALMQAYLGDTSWAFSTNRAPGGTFGNRNFMAHLSAIGAPAIIVAALTNPRRRWFVFGVAGATVLAAALVLSRSRAAWLAIAIASGMVLLVAWLARPPMDRPRVARRAMGLAMFVAIGVAAAAYLPNRLEWRSASPYLDTMRGVVNYREGSGAGRLVQYRNSLKMALAHPLVGVGPGNWTVAYPKYASRNDPSMSSEGGITANPWPSSDWVALVSERGLPAAALLALALLGLLARALRQARPADRPRDPADGARLLMLTGTIVATVVVGAFDAVLLLAAPTVVMWVMAGALATTPSDEPPAAPRARELLPAALVAAGLLFAARSSLQVASMAQFDRSRSATSLERASILDRGSYRVRVRAAHAQFARGNCRRAVVHARAARSLMPNAAEPRVLLRRCGATERRA